MTPVATRRRGGQLPRHAARVVEFFTACTTPKFLQPGHLRESSTMFEACANYVREAALAHRGIERGPSIAPYALRRA